MNARLIELAERRATLVARAATQRTELAQALSPWRGPLAIVDQGVLAARYLGRHPGLVVGAVAFFAVLSPKRVFGWLRRGWVVWRMALAVKRVAEISALADQPASSLLSAGRQFRQ